jgi:DNA-binding Lrp family transcriptional regulator
MERITALCESGIITRLGVIVRHRDLGWASNAMVVWNVVLENIAAAGESLAALPGVTLCYQRKTEDVWPYALYAMVHAKTRPEAQAVISKAATLPALHGVAHKVLFSTHCYKQTGAWLHRKEAA